MADDIINVGISIDPRDMTPGAAAAEQALDKIGKSADAMNQRVQSSMASAGDASQSLSQQLAMAETRVSQLKAAFATLGIEPAGKDFAEASARVAELKTQLGLVAPAAKNVAVAEQAFNKVGQAAESASRQVAAAFDMSKVVSLGNAMVSLGGNTAGAAQQLAALKARLTDLERVKPDLTTKGFGRVAAAELAVVQRQIDATTQSMSGLTDVTNRSGAAAGGATLLNSHLRGSLSNLASAAVGVPGPIGSIASKLLLFGAGGGVTIAVLAGLSLLATAWTKWRETVEAEGKMAADAWERTLQRMRSTDKFIELVEEREAATLKLRAAEQSLQEAMNPAPIQGGGGEFFTPAVDPAAVSVANLKVSQAQTALDNIKKTIDDLRKTVQEDLDPIERLTQNAQTQAATFNMTAAAVAEYTAKLQGATPAQAAVIRGLVQTAETGKRIFTLTQSIDLLTHTMNQGEAAVAGYTARQAGASTRDADRISELTRQQAVLQIMAEAYHDSTEAIGLTGVALQLYRARQLGATEAQLDAIASAGALTAAHQREADNQAALTRAIEDGERAERERGLTVAKSLDQLRQQAELEERIAKADPANAARLRAEAAIRAQGGSEGDARLAGELQARVDRATAAQQRLAESAQKHSKIWEETWTQAIRNTTDIMADFILKATSDGTEKFSKFMEQILRMIHQIASQMAAAGLINFIVGAASGGAGASAGSPGAPAIDGGTPTGPLAVNNPSIPDIPDFEASIPREPQAVRLANGRIGLASPTPVSTAPGGVVEVHQNITFQISAIDTQDMEAALRRQKGTIASVVAEAAQQSTGFASQLAGRKR